MDKTSRIMNAAGETIQAYDDEEWSGVTVVLGIEGFKHDGTKAKHTAPNR